MTNRSRTGGYRAIGKQAGGLGCNYIHFRVLKFQNIEVHILEGENLLNFLRWLSSYSQRRDDHETSFEHLEKFKAKYPRPKKYVPGKVKNGQFSIVQPDYEDGEVWNKTAMFWKTKACILTFSKVALQSQLRIYKFPNIFS